MASKLDDLLPAIMATLAEARAQGFRIVDLTLEQVCELHAARELYSRTSHDAVL
jgi:hypothetical protein